jgi:hypothetical protein
MGLSDVVQLRGVRLAVVVPATANLGTYTGTLTFGIRTNSGSLGGFDFSGQ